jgi:hypothetical protein
MKATDRVNRISSLDLPKAFAAIGEAVWWITIVNDSLKHGHENEYTTAVRLTSPSPSETLDGMRSVRNRIGHEVDLVDFVYPAATRDSSPDGRITAWAWRSVAAPTRGKRSENEHARDLKLHKAYEAALAGQNVIQAFTLATGFFDQVNRVRDGLIGT